MGCPMKAKSQNAPKTSEYPFESLYRPWSWILSSFNNVLLIVIIVGVLYALYKRRNGKKKTVPFRFLNVNTANEGSEDGIIAVVTGGNGSVGRRLVRKLAQEDRYKVKSLDLWIPDEDDRTDGVSSYIQNDITNYDDLVLAFKGADVVFHTASLIPTILGASRSDFHRVNVLGTENVVNACKACGVQRLIYTSSASVVMSKDHPSTDLDESTPLPKRPFDAYVATKGAAETIVRGANGSDGLLTCALRPAGIFGGTGDSMKQCMNSPTYIGDGSKCTFFVLIDDVVNAHFLAEEKLRDEGSDSVVAGKAYNLAVDDQLSTRELFDFLAEQNGTSARSIPYFVLVLLVYFNVIVHYLTGRAPIFKTLTPMVLGYARRTVTVSSALAHKELGWEKQPPWKEVLKKAIEQYKTETESKKHK